MNYSFYFVLDFLSGVENKEDLTFVQTDYVTQIADPKNQKQKIHKAPTYL